MAMLVFERRAFLQATEVKASFIQLLMDSGVFYTTDFCYMLLEIPNLGAYLPARYV